MDSRRLVALGCAVLLSGCGGGGGGGGAFQASTTNTATTVAPATGTAAPAPVTTYVTSDIVPLICVHGITADPSFWTPFLALYGQGRQVVPSLFALEADQLQPGSLPMASVVSAGYYQESETSPKYDTGHDSIGGEPVPRTDAYASQYTISYVDRLTRIVEGVRRATGSDRVDLVLHSMGNIVGRTYARWHSFGAANGLSKVRRIFSIAGPNRGINAVEAYSFGFDCTNPLDFMRLGEIAEMCYEYPGWQNKSLIDYLNDDWDGFCTQYGVSYGGISGTGAYGPQDGPPGTTTVLTITGTILQNVIQALWNKQTIFDLEPFYLIFWPNLIVPESVAALGAGDHVVTLASSRLDQAPFGQAVFWSPVEARHDGNWNPEQSIHGSTFTSELAREFIWEGNVPAVASLASYSLTVVDAPNTASWIALETSATGVTAAQLVEEVLDSSGNVVGGAQGYGAPIHDGFQRAFFSVPAGGGSRHYHLVLEAPDGPVATDDVTVTLTNGALEVAPITTFVSATTSGTAVQATFASNTTDPSLVFTFRLDAGAWTPFGASPTFDTPPLPPGEHRLEARCRDAANAAGLLADDARGCAIGILVDSSGNVTIRR